MDLNLNFDCLFRLALEDWPRELDLSALQNVQSGLVSYTVKGLGNIDEEIEQKYIGSVAEVIWCDLHSAIYEVILAAAKLVTRVDLSAIRPESVRMVFERRLRKAAASNDLNWRPEDYALVDTYFRVNDQEQLGSD